jgi:hypothetical protein
LQKGSPAAGSIAAVDSRRVGMPRWQLYRERYLKFCVTGSAAVPRSWFARRFAATI